MITEKQVNALEATVIESTDIVQEDAPDALDAVFADGAILSFDETSLCFLPDSTELAAPDDAYAALAYVIDYMLANPDFELLICGTTTSAGEADSSIRFSQQRADTVKALLTTDTGIDAGRIHTLGCGYSSMLYISDRTDDSQLDETVAPRNRSVKLVDYRCETAARIVDSLSTR